MRGDECMIIKEDGIGMTYKKLIKMIDLMLAGFEAEPFELVPWEGTNIVISYN